jgi:membrane protease YdiL (CAAX protease family)
MTTSLQTLHHVATPIECESIASLFEHTALFEGLDAGQRRALEPMFHRRTYATGETIIAEDLPDPHLYVLGKGSADVLKATLDGHEGHFLKKIVAGEAVGELKLADPDPRTSLSSASVVASEEVVTWVLHIPDLDRVDPAIRRCMTANVAKVMADRLRNNNETAAEAMQKELEQSRERVAAGVFAIALIAIIACFDIVVAGIKALDPANLPPQAYLSPIFILTPCIPIAYLIRTGHYTASSYGLTMKGWPRIVLQAVLYSLPVLAAITAFKAVWIALDPKLSAEPLFNTHAIFEDGQFDTGFYVASLVIYALVCPAQEFFARAGLQTALARFIPRGDGSTNWGAIAVSNLVFGLAHNFIGFGFAMGAFIPGLFWGWLFDRQRSLVGVTVSHAIIGLYSLQVLGIQPIIGGH